jgi:hypothetical protein
MRKRPLQKCEIHLPLSHKDSGPIDQDKIVCVLKDLVAVFGSFTAPNRRTWRYDGLGCVEILKIEILTTGDKLTTKRLKGFKERLKGYLPQVDILITIQSIQVI